MNTCPECSGRGVVLGYGCPGFKPMELPCRFCDATGAGIDERRRWRASGEVLRAMRLGRDLSLREAARVIEIGAVDLSDAEHGRVNPEPYMWQLAERQQPKGDAPGRKG